MTFSVINWLFRPINVGGQDSTTMSEFVIHNFNITIW